MGSARSRSASPRTALGRGLTASLPISPSHADWDLREQHVIFELLPTRETGVGLNVSCLMRPLKSLAMVISPGERMITHGQDSPCEYCALKETCMNRRLPDDA